MKKFYYINVDDDAFYNLTKNIVEEDLLESGLLQINQEDIFYIGEFEKWDDANNHIIKYGYLSLIK